MLGLVLLAEAGVGSVEVLSRGADGGEGGMLYGSSCGAGAQTGGGVRGEQGSRLRLQPLMHSEHDGHSKQGHAVQRRVIAPALCASNHPSSRAF